MNQILPTPKPKLIYLQWDHRPNAGGSEYLLLHMQQHVKSLSTHFDVVVINHDCDFDEVCEIHHPDLALFESGYRSHGSRPIKIRNARSHASLPKLGLHNADAWCDRRSGFLSDMDHWGIETFFSISTLMPQYTPEIAGRMFIWPNSVDPDLYHDYSQHKTIPIMLTGQVYGLYPWREKVFPLIRDHYPCLISPKHTYGSRSSSGILSGEKYARALNASLVVPTCGTAGGEVVRKHFEIPAAKACLITERTAALEAAGFVHMENCIFADQRDVLDWLEFLFANLDEMHRITEAGHNFVQGCHTLRDRPQIYQWLMLSASLRGDEKIIQAGPFGDLERVGRGSGRDSVHVVGSAPDRKLLMQGNEFLRNGRLEEATTAYGNCLKLISYLPEARFRLALCALKGGDAKRACHILTTLIRVTTTEYGAVDPDPVEWAYFLIALLCQGRVGAAKRLLNFYPGASHLELRRVQRALESLAGSKMRTTQSEGHNQDRSSIHVLPSRTEAEWLSWFADALGRCGQRELVVRLGNWADVASGKKTSRGWIARATDWDRSLLGRRLLYASSDRLIVALGLVRLRPNVPPMPEFRYLSCLARLVGREILGERLGSARTAISDVQRHIQKMRRGGRRLERRVSAHRVAAASRPVRPGSPQ